MSKKLVLLINPLQLNELLCQSLSAAGIQVLALYTTPPGENNYFAINPDNFILSEVLTKDFDKDIKRIKEITSGYQLVSILPAVEVDFEYAEKIAYAVCPQMANHPSNSHLRYKKYDMNDAVRQAGLNSIPQIRLSMGQSIEEIALLHFPVVVKPSFQSGGSMGVKICNDMNEVQMHLAMLQQSHDPYGNKLESDILIQEKIEGEEYFADSVTWNGKHFITAIFRYKKIEINGLPIYRYVDFVSPQDEVWELCYDYIQKALDALQVTHGFGHTEFILTSTHKPYLIEINPRMSGFGGEANRLCQRVTGYDQSTIYLSLLNNDFSQELMQEKYKTQNKHGRIVLLFSWKDTMFTGFKSELLNNLNSAQYNFRVFKAKNTLLTAPQNLLDIVTSINIVDENIRTILEDTDYLQELEKAGNLFHE
jgi:biotin carboxylase